MGLGFSEDQMSCEERERPKDPEVPDKRENLLGVNASAPAASIGTALVRDEPFLNSGPTKSGAK